MKTSFKHNKIFAFALLLSALFVGQFVTGQNRLKYGHLPYKNYPRNIYNGQQQNFGIVESEENTIIIANKNVVLEFDGNFWTKVGLDNDQDLSPKSVFKTNSGRILVGAEDKFGYLDYMDNGARNFISLSKDIDADLIGKIWSIYGINDKYYFVAEKAIFVYEEEKESLGIINYPDDYTYDNSSNLGKDIFISLVKREAGNNEKILNHLILETKTGTFKKFLPEIKEFHKLKAVKFITNWKNENSYLAITQTGEAYSIDLSKKAMFELNVFNMGVNDVMISITEFNGLILFSTEKNGVFVFDKLGQLIRQINDKDGLIDNSVNYSFIDSQNNLWCSTSNGISLIELSSPVSYYGKSDGIKSKLEDIVSFNGRIFAASTDIETLDQSHSRNSFVGMRFGQPSFKFTKIRIDGKEKVLIVGYDGIYSMDTTKRIKSEIPNLYAWEIIQSKVDSNRIYIGTETDGIASAYWDGNNFKLETFYPNTGELVRSIVEHNGVVYYGLSRVGLARLDTTKSQEENIIPGIVSEDLKDFDLEIFQGKLYVGTTDGLYYLDEKGTKAIPFDQFDLVEKDLYVHRVFNESNRRLWLVLFYKSDSDEEKPVFGYLEPSKDGTWKFTTAPFKYFSEDIVQGLAKDEKGNVWLGADAQSYVVNMDQISKLNTPFKITINKFYIDSDSTLFENYSRYNKELPDLPFSSNSIKIEVSAQSYYGGAQNLFRFRIEGGTWSEWSDLNWREYQNLSEGTYTIEIQGMDYYGNESEILSITFTILPPWYRTWWAYVIYVIAVITIIWGLIMLSLQRVKQQKKRLEAIVKERTAEIAEQNEILAEQKDEIELKNQDILDSIKYAKRIQDSILPPNEVMNEMFNDYFVLFKPKDIVSGDFYWAEHIDGKALFAAVDCTGHGVPGAMVSVVGNNGLNRSVKEFNLRKPGAILDKLRDIVIEAFNAQNNMDVKDGMDMALCSIDHKNMKLEFAGANNPCIIIRDGEILETKADKQPIGQFINKTPFTNHEIELKKGDAIYVYSDGYVDQFGGEKGKKLKSKPFKNLLLEIQDLSMKEQHQKLDEMFEGWRGNYEQIDDVCVFGVKI